MSFHPAVETTSLHLLLALFWFFPARRLKLALHPAGHFSLGYIMGATVLLLMNHFLEFAGIHSYAGVWTGVMAAWICLMRLPPGGPPKVPVDRLHQMDCAWLALLTIAGLGLRLYDPLTHTSFAGGDSYTLLHHVRRFMHDGVVFSEYIAGIPVLLGSLRIQASPFDVLHNAPAVMASLGIPAFFALGEAIGGRKVAWITAIGMAGAFGILHIVSFYMIVVQFTTLLLVLPYLMIFLPLALREGGKRNWIIVACVWLFLILTGTYFALMLCAALGICLVFAWGMRAISPAAFLRGLLLIGMVPAWIGFHYSIAVPLRNLESTTTFGTQVNEFEKLDPKNVETAAARVEESSTRIPPAIRSLLLFAGPKRMDILRPSVLESVFLLALAGLALAMVLSHAPASPTGFAGMVILFSYFCTITGAFEMPGYQGRYIYLLLLLGLPLGASTLHHFIAPRMFSLARTYYPASRWLFHPKGILTLALLACIPSFLVPPEAGVSIPTGPDMIVRNAPEDDFLTRLAIASTSSVHIPVVFIQRDESVKLAGVNVAALKLRSSHLGLHFNVARSGRNRALLDVIRNGRPFVLVMSMDLWAALKASGIFSNFPPSLIRVIYSTDRTAMVSFGMPSLPNCIPAADRILKTTHRL